MCINASMELSRGAKAIGYFQVVLASGLSLSHLIKDDFHEL